MFNFLHRHYELLNHVTDPRKPSLPGLFLFTSEITGVNLPNFAAVSTSIQIKMKEQKKELQNGYNRMMAYVPLYNRYRTITLDLIMLKTYVGKSLGGVVIKDLLMSDEIKIRWKKTVPNIVNTTSEF